MRDPDVVADLISAGKTIVIRVWLEGKWQQMACKKLFCVVCGTRATLGLFCYLHPFLRRWQVCSEFGLTASGKNREMVLLPGTQRNTSPSRSRPEVKQNRSFTLESYVVRTPTMLLEVKRRARLAWRALCRYDDEMYNRQITVITSNSDVRDVA